MEEILTVKKRVCAICNKEINCPEECFVVEDGTKSSNSYNKQFVYICRDCYEKSKKYTFTQEQLDQHDAEVKKQVVEELREWYYKKLLEVRQKDKIQSEDKGSEEEMARLYALFLGRYNILGDLKQKINDFETTNKKGEKDE